MNILGSFEAATEAGLTPNSFSRLRREGKAPPPDWVLSCGPIWKLATIRRWVKTRRSDED